VNQTDARAFIIALNGIVPYVPPMLMAQITGSPVCKLIEQVANTPEGMPGEIERPKPRVVDG